MIRFFKNCVGLIITLFMISCGGSLTQEQKEKAKKAIEEGQIKRITPVQLTEAALTAGKRMSQIIRGKDPFLYDTEFIDSIAIANGVVIYALRTDSQGLSTEEKSIADAYQSQSDLSGIGDNVQKLSGDTLLYTFPIGRERPDGSIPFNHAIAIKMAVRQLVLSME